MQTKYDSIKDYFSTKFKYKNRYNACYLKLFIIFTTLRVNFSLVASKNHSIR